MPAEPDPKEPKKDDPPKPDPPKPEPSGDDLAAMKDALRKANKEAADSRAKLQELSDRDKSDAEKLADRVTAAEKRADEAEARALRIEVAIAKGLKPAQAKYVTGVTREEMETSADEVLRDFGGGAPAGEGDGGEGKPGDPAKPNPTNRPKENLQGGGDPSQPAAPDMRKVVDTIPR